MYIKNMIDNFNKYSFLLKQLIARDFKVKYKRSVLGVLWSLLYPVLMMAVMAVVFSNVFKFSVPGVNYLVYLMTGLTFFNYYSEASNLSMSAVVANFSLLNKIYIPKYIFPLSKCLFVGINFLLTLIPLYGVILISGSGETKCHITVLHLLLPYSYLCLLIFTVGVGFILSTLTVFLRDMLYIYGIVITILTYFTPIMYDISMLDPWIQQVLKLNPLYHYITFARTIILYDQVPGLRSFLICGVSCLVVLIIGIVVFKKNQDKFIYYM